MTSRKKKLSNISIASALIVAAVSAAAFIWNSEAAQDRRAAEIETNVAVITVTQDAAQEMSDKVFADLHEALSDHRKILSATRETLIAVRTTQTAIRADVTRLTKAVDDLTKALRDSREMTAEL